MKKATFLSLATLLFSAQAFAQAAGGSAVGDKGLYALGLGLALVWALLARRLAKVESAHRQWKVWRVTHRRATACLCP